MEGDVLHINVAGKETRSINTWDKQFEMINKGEAFLVLGEYDNELVTGGLFLYSNSVFQD